MFSKEALLAVLIPNIGGIINSTYTRRGQRTEWYKKLRLPPMTPPAWVSGTMWVLHFTCMGLASYLIWNLRGFTGYSLGLYLANLFFCFAWAPIFFELHSLTGGLIVGLLNLVSASATTLQFYKTSPAAAVLMIPYLVWLAFTTLYLNHNIYLLNKKPYKIS